MCAAINAAESHSCLSQHVHVVRQHTCLTPPLSHPTPHPPSTINPSPPARVWTRPALHDPYVAQASQWKLTEFCPFLILFVPSCLSIWALIRFSPTCAAECVSVDLVGILAIIPAEHIVANTVSLCPCIFSSFWLGIPGALLRFSSLTHCIVRPAS